MAGNVQVLGAAIHAPTHTGTRDWLTPELPMREPGAAQHQAFLEMVRGTRAADATGSDGLASVLVAEAIYRSDKSRREATVEPHGGPA